MASDSPLINLCDPIFNTVVTCDTVSSEGYEVTNLLSEDSQKRKSGFLGDRFIKPPVEISLKFPFDVNIRYILIGAEVGQQKSSGLEVHSSSFPYNSSLCSGSTSSENHKRSGLACSPVAERIGSINLSDSEKGVVFFCPLQYGRQSPNPVPNIKPNFIQRSMMWKKRSVIAHTASLAIRIFRTHGSSVPAIGSLEIWGGPSSCMLPNQLSDVMKLWKTAQKEQTPNELEDVINNVTPAVPHMKCDEPVADVPEEFLDAITWEIMALPMVLPSGKVVDQRTLDLHAQAEANWGRHPSDPFTGIIFSEGCRPLLDSSLKARIDRFLVLNQDRKDLKAVPRTVGRVHSQICHQSISRFRNSQVCFSSADNFRKRSHAGSPLVHYENNVPGRLCHVTQPIRHSSNVTSSSSVQKSSGLLQESSLSCSEPKRSKVVQGISSTTTKEDCIEDDIICLSDIQTGTNDRNETAVSLKTHEERLDDSLDFALKSALSKLPSFVNPPVLNVVIKECGSCKTSHLLYSLPCSHFLCRPCLVNVSKQTPSTCQCCKVEFKSCDPLFHHH